MVEATGNRGGEWLPAQKRAISEFSGRNIRNSTFILLAQVFGTTQLAYLALTLVMIPMTQEFGWGRTEFSLATTALLWGSAASQYPVGYLIDRLGVRIVMLACTLVVGLATLAVALQGPSVWTLCAIYAVLGIFGPCALGYEKVINSMFTRNRGKALAVLGVESTVAFAVIPIFQQTLIEFYGWRGMFAICGGIVLLFLIPIYFMLEEPGAQFLSEKPSRSLTTRGKAVEMEGLAFGEVMRSGVFWIIVIAGLIASTPRAGMLPHQIGMVTAQGFSTATAVTFVSIMTIAAPLGTLVAGFALDKINSPRVVIPFKACLLIGTVMMALAHPQFGGVALLLLSAAVMGAGTGTARPSGTYFNVRFLGLRAFGRYSGVQYAVGALLMGFAAPLFGYIFDVTGSYNWAYVILIATLVLCIGLYLMLPRYRFAADFGLANDEPAQPDTASAVLSGTMNAGPAV